MGPIWLQDIAQLTMIHTPRGKVGLGGAALIWMHGGGAAALIWTWSGAGKQPCPNPYLDAQGEEQGREGRAALIPIYRRMREQSGPNPDTLECRVRVGQPNPGMQVEVGSSLD